MEKKMDVGIDKNNMDLTVAPGDNFYDFASKGWRRANPIPAEHSRYGAFTKLDEQVLVQVQELITGIAIGWHSAGSIKQKIAIIYNQAMDFDKRNADGITPVKAKFDEVDAIKNIAEYLGKAHRYGSAFWNAGIDIDAMDSDSYIFAIAQGGLGLSRDFLLDDDEKSKKIRAEYQKYMNEVFKMFDIKDANANKVYEMEIEMAKSFYPKEKLRIPEENYHKMSYTEFKNKFSGFEWDIYFNASGITPDVIDVNQIEPLQKSLNIIKTKDQGILRAYLKWRIANGAMKFLGDAQYDLSFGFYDKILSGKEERRPKWKDAIGITEDVLGEAVGQMYVEKHFPSKAKKRMVDLVENLRKAYADRIKALEWMSQETKEKALAKLGTFRVKIGYPDKWRDFSKLSIVGDSLYNDLERATEFENEFWIEKLRGKKVDKDMWLINVQAVNAYYMSSTNEICFPAGILQPPFFDMNADDAFNYGAIGAIIGHEMTHGFDDQGRHYDKDGNMIEWWSATDADAFKVRTDMMRDFFNNIEVAPGIKANGDFTLGENLADLGGLEISLTAYLTYGTKADNTEDFTDVQRYFIAYSGAEVFNIRDEEIVRLTKTNPHSLSEWRVNGIIPHIDAWYEAFGIGPESKLYIPPEKRVKVW